MRRLFWLVAAVAVVPFVGVIYQKLGEQADRRRHGSSGMLVPVGYLSLSVRDAAPELEIANSSPTIVFESGIGATSQNWTALQRIVAQHVRTFSYDRAGLGWSSSRTSTPTPEHLSRELRALLSAAGVPSPYLLVAHSFGGLVARRFAAAYPSEVVGLVLIDPMRPDDWPPLNQTASIERGIRLARVGRMAARFGLTRLFMRSMLLGSHRIARALCHLGGEPAQNLMDRMLCEVGKMPHEVWPSVAANWSRPEFFRTLEAYFRAIPQTIEEMHGRVPLAVPVVVLTPISAAPLSASQLRAISCKARQVIAPASAHWIHLDEPELVLAAIREMLAAARQNEAR
jgi:pimeloyl-ACP methyl ester carboxylesterase